MGPVIGGVLVDKLGFRLDAIRLYVFGIFADVIVIRSIFWFIVIAAGVCLVCIALYVFAFLDFLMIHS